MGWEGERYIGAQRNFVRGKGVKFEGLSVTSAKFKKNGIFKS